jgi:teichuronic acid biosynthesis glycosyltransferase TuaH
MKAPLAKPLPDWSRLPSLRETSAQSPPRAADRPAGRDIVFISLEDWDEIWRRNQIVCDELARRDPARRILFVGRSRDVSNAIRRGNVASLLCNQKRTETSRPNIISTSAIKLLPNSIPAARLLNELFLRRHVQSLMKRLGIVNPILWINDHAAVHLVGRLDEAGTIYDITDDWLTLTQSPTLTQLIRRQDKALCEKADSVIVCSRQLLDLKKNYAAKADLIPNGVDVDRYASPCPAPPQCRSPHFAGSASRTVSPESEKTPTANPTPIEQDHSAAQPWPRPFIGYVGTIHPDRLDVPLLLNVAALMSEATFILVGPDYLTQTDRDQIIKRSNIKLIGPVPFEQVPAWMQAFDVTMTPHRVTPFTESLNPIKLWEYLAVGRPIVSTNVAGFRDFPQWVRIASTAHEFVTAIKASLAEDPAISDGRRAEAAKNSWTMRVDQIETILHRVGSRENAS